MLLGQTRNSSVSYVFIFDDMALTRNSDVSILSNLHLLT